MHSIMCFLIWILKSDMFLCNAHVDFWLIELIFSGAGEFECCFLFHCACVISIRNICVEWCLAKGFNWTEGYLKAQHAGRCSIQVNVFIVCSHKTSLYKAAHTLFLFIRKTGNQRFLEPKVSGQVIVHLWYRNINILLMFQVIALFRFSVERSH